MDLDEWVAARREGFKDLHRRVPDWQNRYAERSWWDNYSDVLEKQKAAEDKGDEEGDYFRDFNEFYPKLCSMNFNANMDLAFQLEESPIEKLLLSQIVVVFCMYDPFSLIIPQIEFLERFKQAADNNATIEEFRKESGETLSEIESSLLTDDERTDAIILPFLYECSGEFDCVFMLPQATLDDEIADIIPELAPIVPLRPDILLTHLGTNDRLIVECDGFRFHKGKESFKKDRRRDRVLKHAGFETMRFAGSEINSEPENCALEIFDYVRKHWHFKYFFQEKQGDS